MNNNEMFLGNIMGPPGPTIPIDDEISDTSENAVKSKVVKAYIDNTIGDINKLLAEVVDGTNVTPQEEV